MKALELEKRYNELMADLECVENDIITASNAGVRYGIVGHVYDEYDRISDEMSGIAGQLKALWKDNPESVSPEFREMFEAWEREEAEEEAIRKMGWDFDENGVLEIA